MTLLRLALVTAALAGLLQEAPIRIVLDGDFADWARVPVALQDPADAVDGVVDFREVRTFADARHVYLMFDTGRAVSVQSMSSGTMSLVIDADGNSRTGELIHGLAGVDLVIDASPPPGQTGFFVRRFDPGVPGRLRPESLAAIDLRYSPRHTSDRFEFRLDRGETTAMTIKLVFVRDDRVGDETAPFHIEWPPNPATGTAASRASADDPLSRPPGTDLRVLTWNAAGLTPYDADSVIRILDAIDADVVMLDEVASFWSAESIRRRFSTFRSDRWHVAVSDPAGSHRVVVARGRVEDVLGTVPYALSTLEAVLSTAAAPDRLPARLALEQGGIGASGFVVSIGGRRLLAVPVDLTCCGSPESEQEAWRIAEVESLRPALSRVVREQRVDGVIVGGDFNLVGSRAPLDMMLRTLDLDGSDLDVVGALTLDGTSADTWRARGGRFPPGRLDWMLRSGSTLEVLRAFVFDSQAINPAWLSRHGLRADDSVLASDHLPIVADLRWR